MADVQFGAYVAARTDKAVPVGADLVVVSDSAAANVGKKVSLTNLVTAIVGLIVASVTHVDSLIAALIASTTDTIGWRRAIILGADVANADATPDTLANVTGLQFPVVAGRTYWFRFVVTYTSALSTTGSRWSINGPALTALRYRSQYTVTTTADTINEGMIAYDLPAAANVSSVANGNVAVVEGQITPSASGDVVLRFASEIASSAITAKAGGRVEWMRVL